MSDPVRDIVDHLANRAVLFEVDPDPRQPNRVLYKITAASRDAVQGAIADIMLRVDESSGYAVFDGPRRCGEGFVAQGCVVVYGAGRAS
jgi:hypothetical protein